jgi:hypothetical protein
MNWQAWVMPCVTSLSAASRHASKYPAKAEVITGLYFLEKQHRLMA